MGATETLAARSPGLALLVRRPFEFDAVALRILDIRRRPLAARAISPFDRAHRNPMRPKMGAQLPRIELGKPQGQVIHITALRAWRRTARPAQLPLDIDEINQRAACPHVDEAEIIATPFKRAAENVAIEADGAFHVAHAQNRMIDAENSKGFGSLACRHGRYAFQMTVPMRAAS